LNSKTFDALESVGDHYVEVKLISRSLVTREVITFAILIGLLLTCYLYSRYGKDVSKYLQHNFYVLGLLLYGAAIIFPLLFLPCTYVTHLGYYRQVSVPHSDYRWLWQVGNSDIKFGVLLLEELIVSIAAIFVYLTLRLRHSHKERVVQS